MPKHVLEHCSVAMLLALQVEQCTYVRTYLQRTTHLELLTHVGQRAQGGSTK